MRICLVAPEFPPEFGGMQRYACEIAMELSGRGHQVTVLTRPHLSGEWSHPGVQVLPILRADYSRDRLRLRELRAQFDVWHVMNAAWSWIATECQPVVVSIHGNDFLFPNAVAQYHLKSRLRLPKGDRLDYALARWRTRGLMSKSFPRVARIFANSNVIARAFLEKYPDCSSRVQTVYLGVSDNFCHIERRPRVPGAAFRLLTVCRLSEPRKNVDLILRSLATLRGTYAFEYEIIGEGTLRNSLEQLCKDLNLSDRVKFSGQVDDQALATAYANADLFVLPASANRKTIEGFGIVYIEANACGVPVLAAAEGGAVEAVAPGVSGMFVEEISEQGVAKALTEFLAGKVKFDPQACRDHAASFSWPRVVDQIQAAYASAVKDSL